MNNQVLLISADRVKTITIISDNVDDKYLLSSIRECQDTDFQGIVGSELYNKLKSLIVDGTISDEENAPYKELLDKAQYYLAYSVIEKLVVNTTYKVSNIGLNTTSDENVKIPSVAETFRIRDEYTHKKDYYCVLLQKYLYEQYINGELNELGEDNCYKIHSNLYSAASSPINLGGARGRGKIIIRRKK